MLGLKNIARFALLIMVTSLLLLLISQNSRAEVAATSPATTQVVVKLNPLTPTTIAVINAAYGTTTVKPLLNSSGIYLLKVPAGSTAETIANRMTGDIRLLYAEPNFVGQAPEGIGRNSWVWGGANATPLAGQYAAQMLGLSKAHAISRGAGAIVAVLDRGVQLDHPALAAFWTTKRYDFVGDDAIPQDEVNGIDDDGDGIIDNAFGHGTHVAGIIHLVAPAARIMPLRVLDTDARTDIFRLAEAIIYATDQGANVINMSLGTADKSALLDDITRRATLRGVIVVGAAGNLNSKNRQYPAGSNCVIAVSALDDKQVKATFANYGSWIHFVAPGVSIYSPLPKSGYGWWSGTSMAAPFVAGQAALLYSVKPSLPVRQRIALMAATARSVDASNPNYEGKLGLGLPAIDVSLQRLISGKLPQKNIISGSCTDPLAAAAVETEETESATWIAEEISYVDIAIDDFVLEQPLDEEAPVETDQAQQVFLPLVVR